MNTKNSINESLEVIRRALEDERNDTNKYSSSNILILNQKVNSDGTIKLLQKDEEINSEINRRQRRRSFNAKWHDRSLYNWNRQNVFKW